MKKQLLFAYNAMNIGGSTTSLLSILNRLDYDKYDVDLLLNFNTGVLFDQIPPQVNVLPPCYKYTDKKQEYLHRLLSPRFLYHYLKANRIAKKSGVAIHAAQYREWKDIEFLNPTAKTYDVAVAFLEGDRCKYVARHVTAKRKIAWIHVNYEDARFDPAFDRDTMAAFDQICLVSQDCKAVFDKIFPELSDRTCVVENILVNEVIRNRAKEPVDFSLPDGINFVTVARVSFKSKAQDRAVAVLNRLNRENRLSQFHWFVIGDGDDAPALKRLIDQYGLNDHVTMLGSQINPYPYLNGMSAFFLPSLWEGKPMCVTEGFIMGLPAVVTAYSSAHEQVRHMVDGFVMENSEEGLYNGLKTLLAQPELLDDWKQNVSRTDYSNLAEIHKVEQLFGD